MIESRPAKGRESHPERGLVVPASLKMFEEFQEKEPVSQESCSSLAKQGQHEARDSREDGRVRGDERKRGLSGGLVSFVCISVALFS